MFSTVFVCVFYALLFCIITACSDSFIDERDGQSYDMVQIGNQIWMAENLNFAGAVDAGAINPKDGAANPNVNVSNGATFASFCPDGDNRNCKKYGRLYEWEAAQTICPAGWRLPTKDDFEKLFNFVGGQKGVSQMASSEIWMAAGTALKSTSGWYKKKNGSDEFDFDALPAGYKNGGSRFDGIGGFAHFWSITANGQNEDYAYYVELGFGSTNAEVVSGNKYDARSVRCIRK